MPLAQLYQMHTTNNHEADTCRRHNLRVQFQCSHLVQQPNALGHFQTTHIVKL